MRNLWEKDRKVIYKELLRQYLEEGYSHKDAKKLAAEETEDMVGQDARFVKDILDSSDDWG